MEGQEVSQHQQRYDAQHDRPKGQYKETGCSRLQGGQRQKDQPCVVPKCACSVEKDADTQFLNVGLGVKDVSVPSPPMDQ